MNLPDSAIEFLDAFRGILAEPELREAYAGRMPMVHCHCFTKEVDDQTRAETNIKQVSSASVLGRSRSLRRLIASPTEGGGKTGSRFERRRHIPPRSVGFAWQGHVLYKLQVTPGCRIRLSVDHPCQPGVQWLRGALEELMKPDHAMTAENGTVEAKSESLRQSLSLPSVPDISPQVRRIRVRPHRRPGFSWVLKVSHHIYPNVPPRFTPPLPDAALR